jgi:hypothetical protein
VGGGFERFIGIDWSGAARPSGQHVYVAEAHRQDARITVQSLVRARDRSAVESYLRGDALAHASAWADWPGPRPLDRRARRIVALDFAFGFPTEFRLPGLEGAWRWDELSAWAAQLADGRNGSLDSLRQAIEHDAALAPQFRLRGGDSALMHKRLTDTHAPGRPESVFHLIGPSQVGLGSITGIAMLHRLRERDGLALWPFDPQERIDAAAAVMVEIFPRMWLAPGIRKNELPGRVRQVQAWQHDGIAFRNDAELAVASSGDALDAVAAAIGAARSCYRLPSPDSLPPVARRREGWIAGVQVPARPPVNRGDVAALRRRR